MISVEFIYDDLALIVDPARPDRAIGYINGVADIEGYREGYVIADIWASNSAENGRGLVLIPNDHPLFALLEASLRQQFDAAICDAIQDEVETAA